MYQPKEFRFWGHFFVIFQELKRSRGIPWLQQDSTVVTSRHTNESPFSCPVWRSSKYFSGFDTRHTRPCCRCRTFARSCLRDLFILDQDATPINTASGKEYEQILYPSELVGSSGKVNKEPIVVLWELVLDNKSWQKTLVTTKASTIEWSIGCNLEKDLGCHSRSALLSGEQIEIQMIQMKYAR